MEENRVVVVGGGIAGSCTALFLARRGFPVIVVEKRPDFRGDAGTGNAAGSLLGNSTDSQKRSINLALSHRGRSALKALGLEEAIMSHAVRMSCRAMHAHDGTMTFQPYGTKDQAIWSISRTLMNRVLLDAAEAMDNVSVRFKTSFVGMTNRDGQVVTLESTTPSGDKIVEHVPARLVFGADGAYSKVRSAMLRQSRTNFSRLYIPHGYKELNIDPKDGGFAMECPNALHIWPRGDFMMIALPNPDKTFTCTLFAPFDTIESLGTDATQIAEFFEREFPDAVPLMGGRHSVVKQFRENPTGALVTIKTKPWNLSDRVCLIGDAAHAVVPFYGQGMNAACEDALVLDEVLERCQNDLAKAVPEFAKLRQPQADGLAELSFRNYVEMRAHTANPAWLLRKKIEAGMHWALGAAWIPQYTMVAFTRIPYDDVIRREERQDTILNRAMNVLGVGALATAAVFAAGMVEFYGGPPLVTRAKESVSSWAKRF